MSRKQNFGIRRRSDSVPIVDIYLTPASLSHFVRHFCCCQNVSDTWGQPNLFLESQLTNAHDQRCYSLVVWLGFYSAGYCYYYHHYYRYWEASCCKMYARHKDIHFQGTEFFILADIVT
ncbi:hypothetical protein BDZ45DRAFT_266444 [Acephala macrosclerotiorum]|nr:hypothetical protein BDZ45DRAFT_266444 [Acephala macrosclerotiorum]